jgi:hypothetical protein
MRAQVDGDVGPGGLRVAQMQDGVGAGSAVIGDGEHGDRRAGEGAHAGGVHRRAHLLHRVHQGERRVEVCGQA